jgi:hypothetical protein
MKKIIGIFVCMLLIATAVPAVMSVNNSELKSTVQSAPLTSGPEDHLPVQKLIVSDGAYADDFGYSVAVDGNYAIIGAQCDDNDLGEDAGAAYIFEYSGTSWGYVKTLYASDGAAGDEFGCSVALDGDTAVVGAWADDNEYGQSAGAAYIFTKGTTWEFVKKLTAGGPTQMFGGSVAISGDTIIIGAPCDNGGITGAAYVFIYDTIWSFQKKLGDPDGSGSSRFGNSVDVNGDTFLIGAPWDYNPMPDHENGSAFVFNRTDAWTWVKLLAWDGTHDGADFGQSVSLDGDTALVDAPEYGMAYVFTHVGPAWKPQALLPHPGAVGLSNIQPISLSGDTILLGSYWFKDEVYVFTRTDTTWVEQQKLVPFPGATGIGFGVGVSLDGDTAFIGADSGTGNVAATGCAYVFERPVFQIDIAGGFGVKATFTNIGNVKVTDFPWQIKVDGTILKKVAITKGGTTTINVGLSDMQTTGLFWGLDIVNITAKIGSTEKTAKGLLLLCYVFVFPS